MATYVPNANQTTEPTESKTVESAALELRTLKKHALQFLTADADASKTTLPAATARAGKFLAFDSVTGEPVIGPDIADWTVTQAQIADVETVATNMADVNLVVDNMAALNNLSDAVTNGDLLTDVYQGAHAAAPVLRLDGAVLQTGDLYFNTTNSQMFTYDGASWIDYEAAAVVAQLAAEAAEINAETAQTAAELAETHAETAQNNAETAETGAVAAKVAAEAARDAALIQAGVYVDEPTGRAAVADGVAFKVQGSGDVAAYEYRRIDAVTVSTLIATYPSAAAVDGVAGDVAYAALQMGRQLDQGLSTGTVGDTTPNTASLGAGAEAYAPVALCPVDTVLKSVSFRTSGAGTFTIQAYRKLTDTTWQCTAEWPTSTAAATGDLVTLTAGDGVIPNGVILGIGDFIGLKSGTARPRYTTGTGGWINLNGEGTVGAIVTRNLNTNGYIISLAFDYYGVNDNLTVQISALDTRLDSIESENYPVTKNGSQSSVSLLYPGIFPPAGWETIDAKISGLPVMVQTENTAQLLAMFAGGEKGFAVFANGGPLFQDAAKTIHSDAALDPVRVISDFSPRNTSIAATADTKRPLLKVALSGAPYLEFDGANDALEIPAASFGTGAMAFVCSVAVRALNFYPTVLMPLSSGNGPYLGFDETATPRLAFNGGTDTLASVSVETSWPIPLNTRTTLTYLYTGSMLEIYINGVLSGSKPAFGSYVTNTTFALCPTVSPVLSSLDFFGGVYVDRNITTDERQYLESLVASLSPTVNKTYIKQAIDANTTADIPTIYAAIEPDIQALIDAGVKDALLRVGVNYSLAPLITSTKVYSLGDSTVADYSGFVGLVDLVSTVRIIVDIADPGDTIAQQKTLWLAQTIDPALVGWVIVQVGLNDLNPADGSTASKIAALQDLIDTIRSEIGADKKLLIGKMLPCKQRLIDIYGAVDGLVSQQRWVDVNAAIAGEGASPITGVDGRITAHVPLLDDGAGNLAAAYNTGDNIHPNLAGRQLMADEWKAALAVIGLVV